MKNILVYSLLILALPVNLLAEDKQTGLEQKLDELSIPDDKVTPVLSKDNLYIVNTRYSSLTNRHEVGVQGSHNFTADSHLDVKQISGSYRYHLNSKWSFGLRYNYYTNELTSAGQRLLDDKQIIPDQDFAYNSQEIFATYNTIYGKLRWSQETVVYFDQYFSLGAGQIELASGKTNHALLDIGLAFWLKKHGSMRVGVRNEVYSQAQTAGDVLKHNAMGYIEMGWLFGSGDRG